MAASTGWLQTSCIQWQKPPFSLCNFLLNARIFTQRYCSPQERSPLWIESLQPSFPLMLPASAA